MSLRNRLSALGLGQTSTLIPTKECSDAIKAVADTTRQIANAIESVRFELGNKIVDDLAKLKISDESITLFSSTRYRISELARILAYWYSQTLNHASGIETMLPQRCVATTYPTVECPTPECPICPTCPISPPCPPCPPCPPSGFLVIAENKLLCLISAAQRLNLGTAYTTIESAIDGLCAAKPIECPPIVVPKPAEVSVQITANDGKITKKEIHGPITIACGDKKLLSYEITIEHPLEPIITPKVEPTKKPLSFWTGVLVGGAGGLLVSNIGEE